MAAPTTILVEPAHAAELQREALGRRIGAHEKVLWFDGASRASVLHLGPNARLAPHKHRSEVHHIWIVSGSCLIQGHRVQTGCYLYVPVGAEHDAKAGIEGCVLFYLIQPEGNKGGERHGSS